MLDRPQIRFYARKTRDLYVVDAMMQRGDVRRYVVTPVRLNEDDASHLQRDGVIPGNTEATARLARFRDALNAVLRPCVNPMMLAKVQGKEIRRAAYKIYRQQPTI